MQGAYQRLRRSETEIQLFKVLVIWSSDDEGQSDCAQ